MSSWPPAPISGICSAWPGPRLFLPFLPLLPKQILLTNLLTDFPEMTIATDSVDSELVGAAAVGYRVYSQVYVHLRHPEFGLRLPYLRRVAVAPPCQRRSLPNRLVSGIGGLGIADRPGHQDQAAVLQEQAGHFSVAGNVIVVVGTLLLPYTELSRRLRFYSHAAGISSGLGRYSLTLYRYCGNSEEDILSEGSLLVWQSCRS